MNLEKIQSIAFSLLKKESDITSQVNKALYEKKKTVKFVLPLDFPREEQWFELLSKDMYNDLMVDAPKDIDSLGLWIEIDNITLDNAIALSTLEAIQEYSADKDINIAYEFFKMTMVED